MKLTHKREAYIAISEQTPRSKFFKSK